LQPPADRYWLGEPAPQCLRAVKEEHAARPRRRVGMVAKQDLGAGGDIFEAELALAPHEMFGHAAHIPRSLIGETERVVPSGFASTTPQSVLPPNSA
jgi:hypothetical protein